MLLSKQTTVTIIFKSVSVLEKLWQLSQNVSANLMITLMFYKS